MMMQLVKYGHPGIQVGQFDVKAEAEEMAAMLTLSTPYKHYVVEGEGMVLPHDDEDLHLIDVRELIGDMT